MEVSTDIIIIFPQCIIKIGEQIILSKQARHYGIAKRIDRCDAFEFEWWEYKIINAFDTRQQFKTGCCWCLIRKLLGKENDRAVTSKVIVQVTKPSEAFSAADIACIVPRVLELVYTAWDMRPFAADV